MKFYIIIGIGIAIGLDEEEVYENIFTGIELSL